MSTHPIVLEETESEYLLTIHASERERAKRIEGRKWDPRRRCWSYPHTQRVYGSLVAEFGDELENRTLAKGFQTDTKTGSPATVEIGTAVSKAARGKKRDYGLQEVPNPLQAKVDDLTHANAKIQHELELANEQVKDVQVQLAEARDEISHLKVQLGVKESGPDVEQLLHLLAEKDRQLAIQREDADRQAAKSRHLQVQADKSQQEAARLKRTIEDASPNGDAKKFLLRLAVTSSGADARFAKMIKEQAFAATLPNVLTNELIVTVANLLRDGGTSPTLHGVLLEARQEDVLNDDQLDLAHLIRRQRNIVVHEKLSKGSTTARVMLTLFAAALLWPELQRDCETRK